MRLNKSFLFLGCVIKYNWEIYMKNKVIIVLVLSFLFIFIFLSKNSFANPVEEDEFSLDLLNR